VNHGRSHTVHCGLVEAQTQGRWCTAVRSLEQGLHHYGARKLTSGGGKERGEHGDPVLSPTRAQAAVWQLSNGDEAVVEEVLDGGSAQARREEVGAVRTDRGDLIL
jgi:hypothetical protein